MAFSKTPVNPNTLRCLRSRRPRWGSPSLLHALEEAKVQVPAHLGGQFPILVDTKQEKFLKENKPECAAANRRERTPKPDKPVTLSGPISGAKDFTKCTIWTVIFQARMSSWPEAFSGRLITLLGPQHPGGTERAGISEGTQSGHAGPEPTAPRAGLGSCCLHKTQGGFVNNEALVSSCACGME